MKRAREAILPHLRISTLLRSLQALSATLLEAQVHTAPFNALHLRIQRITLSTTQLSDRTAATLAAFRHAAATSLDNLDLISDLLEDDLPAVAVSLLSGETAGAVRLATQSRSLAFLFEDAASQLSETLSDAAETRTACEAKRSTLASHVADRWLSLRRAKATAEAASVAMNEAEQLHDAAAKREDSARFKGSVLQYANVAVMVGSVISTRSTSLGIIGMGGAAALSANIDQQVLRAREERAVHLKHRNDAREEKLESSREAAELSERLRAVREEETLAEEALSAIERAVEMLRTLAGVLSDAENFWTALAGGCREEDVDSLFGLVKSGSALAEAERLTLWRSPRLGRRFGEVQARWVALQGICDECISGIGDAKKGLYATASGAFANINETGEAGTQDEGGHQRLLPTSEETSLSEPPDGIVADDREESKEDR